MDQLKLLNYYKMISNFANNLIGAFVSLIILQATGQLVYAVIYLVCVNTLRLIFTISLKRITSKYPQLCLLLRIVPITLYNVFIFILDINLIIGVIGVCIFVALDAALNYLPKEIIFNYSSLSQSQKSDKSIGITRLFEQTGIIVAMIVGGLLLDFNKTLVLILALGIYTLSVIPLVIYYIRCKNEKTFNKDATSNAIITLKRKENTKTATQKITKKILFTYAIIYFSFAFMDLLQTSFGLYVFLCKGEFALAGIINAIFNSFYAIGFYVASAINEKKDTTKLVSILCLVMAAVVVFLPFVNVDTMFIVICLIYGIIGFSYPFLSLFVLDRMLTKSRIMACSNDALFMRESGCIAAYIVGYSFGFIGLVAIFITIGISMASSSMIIPAGEESTRKNIVDFLQNNEITQRTRKPQQKEG
ncbi:MAG: MFS transporter [Clostridiales bacterium]|nr:MFS transporter [Clostridiales bacterium]